MNASIHDVALDRRGMPSAKVLAQYLRKKRGVAVNGMRIEMLTGRSNTSYWRVAGSPAAADEAIEVGGYGGFGGLISTQTADIAPIDTILFPTGEETNPPNPPQPPYVETRRAPTAGITTGGS